MERFGVVLFSLGLPLLSIRFLLNPDVVSVIPIEGWVITTNVNDNLHL